MTCNNCGNKTPNILLGYQTEPFFCENCFNEVITNEETKKIWPRPLVFNIAETPNSQIKSTIDEFKKGNISFSKCLVTLIPAYIGFEYIFVVTKWENLTKLEHYVEAMRSYVDCAMFLGKTKKLLEKKELLDKTIFQDPLDLKLKLCKACRIEKDLSGAKTYLEAIKKNCTFFDPLKEQRTISFCQVNMKNEKHFEVRLLENRKERSGFKKKRETNQYNILSIDGGGIRGIIPAMILCEIEKAVGVKTVGSIFDCFIGTSIGGILSMACAVSKTEELISAYDVFGKFLFHAKEIFSKGNVFTWIGPKYDNSNLKKLCVDLFDDKKIGSVKKDVFITATQLKNKTLTLFSSIEAKLNKFKDCRIVDALMATTAAPTYFQPYEMANNKNKKFVDGGLQANSPVFHAVDSIDPKIIQESKLVVLSLGTGHYVDKGQIFSSGINSDMIDKIQLDFEGSKLYWAKNLSKYIMEQEKQADNFMFKFFQTRQQQQNYLRLQPILPNKIPLDKFDSCDELMNICDSYIEDLYSDENNKFKKFLEILS